MVTFAFLDLDSFLSSDVSISSTGPDDKASNNTYELLSEVTGSYDPNDKLVSFNGSFREGYVYDTTSFEYTIRFHNTGTDTVFTVRVEDVIDRDLDLTSINVVDASHNYRMTISEDTVNWTFNNILLIDSTTNEPASHGFVRFTINQKEDNPEGTVITNIAGIYFDFNDPIITNETMSIVNNGIVTTIEGKNVASNTRLDIYPNLVENILNIDLADEGQFKLFNRLSELVLASEKTNTKDVSHLETGVYFYSLETDKNSYTGKLIKD